VLPRVAMEAAQSAAAPGETVKAAWLRLNKERDALIDGEVEDPLHNGFEPPIWKICDALLEWPWVDPAWAADVRGIYGFKKAVSKLLIVGGYRGSKTDYLAKCAVRMLRFKRARVWCFITSIEMSREVQQPAIWKYLPPRYKGKDIRTRQAYVSYKLATGFSENRFTLENESLCSFRTYNQEENNVEGAAPDLAWCDEPPDPGLITALEGRIAERNGKLVMTFAPKMGYVGVVRDMMKDAETAAESTAFLVPKDNLAPDIEAAMRVMRPEEWKVICR